MQLQHLSHMTARRDEMSRERIAMVNCSCHAVVTSGACSRYRRLDRDEMSLNSARPRLRGDPALWPSSRPLDSRFRGNERRSGRWRCADLNSADEASFLSQEIKRWQQWQAED